MKGKTEKEMNGNKQIQKQQTYVCKNKITSCC